MRPTSLGVLAATLALAPSQQPDTSERAVVSAAAAYVAEYQRPRDLAAAFRRYNSQFNIGPRFGTSTSPR